MTREYARPRRELGQNFLVDPGARRRIVEAAGIDPEDTVLEIGPGRGALTRGLAERAGTLHLVELDRALAAELEKEFADDPHVHVRQADILEVELTSLIPDPSILKVVGNIPYNVTTPILFHLLEPPRPAEILLMVQKEVAERIASEPGSRSYGALSVGVQAVASVEQVLRVSPGAFRPRPKVDSMVIRIRPRVPPPLSPDEEVALRRLTRSLFQWRRKQLRRILRDHPDLQCSPTQLEALLAAAGARPTDRPETVDPLGFRAMAELLAS